MNTEEKNKKIGQAMMLLQDVALADKNNKFDASIMMIQTEDTGFNLSVKGTAEALVVLILNAMNLEDQKFRMLLTQAIISDMNSTYGNPYANPDNIEVVDPQIVEPE